MEYKKNYELLRNIPDKVPRFITKKWIEVYNQSGNEDNRYKPNKQIRFKIPMIQSDLITVMHILLLKGLLLLQEQMMMHMTRN